MSAESSTKEKLERVPKQWPGAFGSYKYSRQTVMFNIGTFAILIVASFVVGVLISLIFPTSGNMSLNNYFSASNTINTILSFIVNTFFTIAVITVFLAAVNQVKVEPMDAVKKSWPKLINYIALSILLSIILGLSLLALVIPFFIVFPRLFLAPYYVIDKNLGITEAISKSWKNTSGHSLKVWGLVGAAIVMILPIFTIIGIPFSIYFLVMFSAAPVILYKYIDSISK